MQSVRFRGLIAVVIIALAAGAAGESPALAESSPGFVYLDGEDRTELENTMTYIASGQVIADGCAIEPQAMSLDPSQVVVEARVLAVDFDTCDAIIIQGTPRGVPDSCLPDLQRCLDDLQFEDIQELDHIDMLREHGDMEFQDEATSAEDRLQNLLQREMLAAREGAGYNHRLWSQF